MAKKPFFNRGNANKKTTGGSNKGTFTQRMQNYMQGRNGSDDLGRASLIAAMILLAISLVFNFIDYSISWTFSTISLVFIIYSFFRMVSPNLEARRRENAGWVKAWTRVSLPVKRFRTRCVEWKRYHKDYRIYTCEKCGQSLRVPKGKGKVKVTCPKCRTSFVKKS